MKSIQHDILETLEFQKVLNQVQNYTTSEMGGQRLLQLKPSADRQVIQRKQDETADGLSLLEAVGGIPLAYFEDIRPHMKRLSIGANLNGQEISQIYRVITNGEEIYDFFEKQKEEEVELLTLYDFAENLVFLPRLAQKIRETIDATGHVLDQASPELQQIRTSIKGIQQQIRDRLNRMITGNASKYLTDTIITMRNDRFVLPVKAENRSYFGGVVHDQSGSGQTVFVEPQAIVNLNNDLRQQQLAERAEEDRLLAELSSEIAPYAEDILSNMNILAEFDVINAKARYAKETKAVRPTISDQKEIALYQARHPLIPADEVVANDILLGQDYTTMIITGPNTGGKTIILKTLGLLQLMGQAGMHLPVEKGSTMGIFTGIYADIGDEQSIEQSLSTFSSHMSNIQNILTVADRDSLVLFDELGAGTDPQEGAALAISILDYLNQIGCYAVITSHYPELKAYGYNRSDTINASMEFDIDSLSPTYRLQIGIPGRSNAFEIAKRLGIPESIINQSRAMMSGESQSVEGMIEDLDQKRKETAIKSRQLSDEILQAETIRQDLEEVYQQFQRERDSLLEKSRKEADKRVKEAQEEAQAIIDELRLYQQETRNPANIKDHELIDAQARLDALRSEEEKQQLQANKVLQKAKSKQDLQVGDEVEVPSFGQRGVLLEKVDDKGKEWMVQVGALRMKLKQDQFVKRDQPKAKESQTRPMTQAAKPRVQNQLDIRGERFEDAMLQLDRYLDAALLNHYEIVTIIHGDGTGALRKGVHKKLQRHPQVEEFALAPANQGGTGATIVHFKG